MIRSFADKETEKLWQTGKSRKLGANLYKQAYKRLIYLETAENLEDMRIPPSNRLEKLSGDRKGQHSIRINKQWRICFIWKEDGAYEVEVTDYH